MEQAEKGIWMVTGIFFFVVAMVVTGRYIGEINRLIQIINKERERSYVMEMKGVEEAETVE